MPVALRFVTPILASLSFFASRPACAEGETRNSLTLGAEISIIPDWRSKRVYIGVGPAIDYAHWFRPPPYGASAGAFAYALYYPSTAFEVGAGGRATWSIAGLEVGRTCGLSFREGEACETLTLMPMATLRYVWLGLRLGFGRDAEPLRIVLGAGAPIAL